jgi:hypothetical protein
MRFSINLIFCILRQNEVSDCCNNFLWRKACRTVVFDAQGNMCFYRCAWLCTYFPCWEPVMASVILYGWPCRLRLLTAARVWCQIKSTGFGAQRNQSMYDRSMVTQLIECLQPVTFVTSLSSCITLLYTMSTGPFHYKSVSTRVYVILLMLS